MIVELVPCGPVHARVAAPASKSVTNRLLVVAALAEGSSRLNAPLRSDDTIAMREAVEALGAGVDEDADGWAVHGTGGKLRAPGRPIDARLSGTTMRFGAALAALCPTPVEVTGAEGLLRRPVGPLTSALRALGSDAGDRDGLPPLRVGGGLAGGRAVVDAAASSQFASALLLVAPYAAGPVTVEVRGAAAVGYVALTAAVMGEWGAAVDEREPGVWHVASNARYRPRVATVDHDASAAAHLMAMAMATGGEVTVTNAASGAQQPDAGITEVFERMGATVARQDDALTVRAPDELTPVDVDLTRMPDQVTTVATLAALAAGVSTITGAAVTRGHETDRLAALATELGKLGVEVDEHPDGLTVRGGGARGPAQVDPHGDHRMAMAFAALGARVAGVRISDAGCVAKTYPSFWEDLQAMGLERR